MYPDLKKEVDSTVTSNVEYRIPMSTIPHLGQELRGGPLASAAFGTPDADIGMALFATAEPRGEKAAVAQLHQCRGVALGKGLLVGKEVFANVDQLAEVLAVLGEVEALSARFDLLLN